MRNIILILAFITICTISYAQKKEANKNYEIGNSYFAAKDFQKAVEYYTLSIEKLPAADAYFNRALSYIKLFDSCNYCRDIHMASLFGDMEAADIYKKKCVLSDTIRSKADSIKKEFPGYSYTLYTFQKCEIDKSTGYYNTKHERLVSIYEKIPEFPGGETALAQFLGKNIVYPPIAWNKGIQGTIYITFSIEKNGDVTNIKILKGIGGGCDEEALRVVSLMPKWKPGTRKGVPMRVQFNMPIRYTRN